MFRSVRKHFLLGSISLPQSPMILGRAQNFRILKSLSIIINILSYSIFISRSYDFGSLTIKSIAIDVYIILSTSDDCSNLYSLCLECFTLLYISQFSMYFCISFLKPGYIKSLVMSSIVFDIPGWPASLLSWCSYITWVFCLSVRLRSSINASVSVYCFLNIRAFPLGYSIAVGVGLFPTS